MGPRHLAAQCCLVDADRLEQAINAKIAQSKGDTAKQVPQLRRPGAQCELLLSD